MTKVESGRVEKFPNDPIFNQLALLASKIERPVVYDASGIEVDYKQFFHDVSRLRAKLQQDLPPSLFNEHGIIHEEYPYICVLATEYDFIVSFYAVLALGGAIAPLASGVLPEEAEYFFQLTKSTVLLVPAERESQAITIKEHIREHAGTDIHVVTIDCVGSSISKLEIAIDSDLVLSAEQPAVAIFTSGTSGRPKAVILARRRFQWSYNLNLDGVIMAYRPPHWVGGLRTLIQPLLQGNRVHILPNRASAEVFWNYLRDIPFTQLSLTPTILRQMKDYFEKNLAYLTQSDVEKYLRYIRNVREITCSSAMIEASTLQFWKSILGKDIITNVYALTEAGVVTKTRPGSTLKHSVGLPGPSVSIKLSNGDHGEALVKGPMLFSKYLNDDEATKQAFDDEGYFRTGDLLRRVGDEYVFEGRASIDFILFYGYRIPIIELESSLMDLPYVAEAYVTGAPDHEAKELPAAIVRLKGCWDNADSITLKKIRQDLSATLAAHKLPAILRVLDENEKIPQTAAGKPIKRNFLKQFLGIQGFVPAGYSWPRTEYWGNQPEQVMAETRPWDWCGLQRND